MNGLREKITNIQITDQGNMLRAYGRNVVDLINQCGEVNTFVPALAYTFARRPTEIVVEHEMRLAGESKYSLYSLIRLNFDLVTGFSLVPLQMFSMLGMVLSASSALLVLLLVARRLFMGAEAEGLFTLFAISFFFMGVILFGIGLLGEYVGRVYQQVRARPRFVIETILQSPLPACLPDMQAAPIAMPEECRYPCEGWLVDVQAVRGSRPYIFVQNRQQTVKHQAV